MWHDLTLPETGARNIVAEINRETKFESLRLFIDSVRDYAVFELRPDGRVASWNTGAERIKGYKPSEIIGEHFSRFYPEEDIRAEEPQRLLNVASREGRVETEGWRVRKDGSKFWARVTITAIKDHDDRLIGFGKVTRDLSEQRRAELALRHSEERTRLFIEAVQDYAIFLLDPDGHVITWNVGAERIKGYSSSEILGKPFSIFYPEADKQSRKPEWELEVAKRQGRFEEEGWRIRKDGSKFWANVIITPVISRTGELLGFTKVTRDFTERMVAQLKLEESQRRLQESESSLRSLSLHLLRTQDEERRRIGREIHDSVGQYLSVLKMKIDTMNLNQPSKELHECANLADECLKEVRTISYLLYPPMLEEMGLASAIPWYLEGFAKRCGIKTMFKIPSSFKRLSRDAELVLFRVLQESLTNVQRHSGSSSADITVSLTDTAVTMRVTDTGKGVPAQVLEESNHDWMGSPGVGLRGMSERLRQLGGTLQIDSSEKGTEVRATLPLGELSPPARVSTPMGVNAKLSLTDFQR